MKTKLLLFSLLLSALCKAQLYFPPLTGSNWDTISPTSLGWCTSRTDSLFNLLEVRKTKAFIILKDGKIAVEKYFGTFTRDSAWYWASAGKSLTGFLTGMAQQKGLLDIHDTVSRYLGTGWTSCPPDKERLITIRHQLTMTTGLDYNVPDDNCTEPSCFKYKADAGSFWYYYNAPYHAIHDVIAAAAGKSFQQFTSQELSVKTGISGAWLDHVFYSKARSMARFGLLMLNHGIWATDTILGDTQYYREMTNTSQPFNEAYGYLWWLNGKNSFKIPGTVLTFNGKLCPPAPDDLLMGLGKNDQKLYVWPSRNIVVVRMGEEADGGGLVPITFDTLLWNELNRYLCSELVTSGVSTISERLDKQVQVWPNPVTNVLNFKLPVQQHTFLLGLYDNQGRKVYEKTYQSTLHEGQISVDGLSNGIYTLRVVSDSEVLVQKFIVNR